MDDCYGTWAKNSARDVVDMLLQALEVSLECVSYIAFSDYELQAIVFVHSLGMAHRVRDFLRLKSTGSDIRQGPVQIELCGPVPVAS